MTAKDLNRWEETDEPGVYRRRLIVPDTERADPEVEHALMKLEGIKPETKDIAEPEIDFGFDVPATAGAIKAAAEHDIDLTTITGTGKDGRITKADVEAAL